VKRTAWRTIVVMSLGCTAEAGPDPFASGGAGSATDSNTSGATSMIDAGTSEGSSSVDDTADPPAETEAELFDVGVGDEGVGPEDGCTKIDFLFVVDNSGSMGAHQQALVDSFGPFMDTIFATVQAQDYHIMVTDSDADGDIQGACEPCTPDSFWCGDWCDAKASLDVACETRLGAGEVAPYNNEASNTICGVPDDIRYLTSDLDQASIKSLFQCMAKVGIFGSGAELPTSAIAAAVGPENQAGGCNADFVRDDAVLVVTFISDDYPVPETDDNASTVGSPQEWYDAVVAAKNGKPENVVMLGIINTDDATCVSGAGEPIVHPTERFVEFVEMFGARGLTGNICSSDYNAFFEQAVGLIDTACDEFEPEG
jgi:hypothetical protein